MGHKDRYFPALPDVTLEDRVPAYHFYRYPDALLDLSFVRDLVGGCYYPIGGPSIDPLVYSQLQLVMFFECVRSERLLIEIAADR